MADIEEARQNFKTNFMTVKGVLGVCNSYYWKPTAPQTAPPALHVYVENMKVIDILPKEFEGFKCEYFVVPGGISPGCD